jgi:hypothetical protein
VSVPSFGALGDNSELNSEMSRTLWVSLMRLRGGPSLVPVSEIAAYVQAVVANLVPATDDFQN